MRELHWGFRKARIWQNSLPDWESAITQIVETSLPMASEPKKEMAAAHIALELSIPIGGKCHYGALSMEFVPYTQNKLLIQVALSGNTGSRLYTGLGPSFDVACKGLPLEYGDKLITYIASFNAVKEIGSGKLIFNSAAHSFIGSSSAFF